MEDTDDGSGLEGSPANSDMGQDECDIMDSSGITGMMHDDITSGQIMPEDLEPGQVLPEDIATEHLHLASDNRKRHHDISAEVTAQNSITHRQSHNDLEPGEIMTEDIAANLEDDIKDSITSEMQDNMTSDIQDSITSDITTASILQDESGQLVAVYDLSISGNPSDLGLENTNEITIDNGSSEGQVDVRWTLPYDVVETNELPSEAEKGGPEVVAVETVALETVVTTTIPDRRVKLTNVVARLSNDSLSEELTLDEINWGDPQLADKILITNNTDENGQVDLATSTIAGQPQWFIALVPDTNGEVVTVPQQSLPQPAPQQRHTIQELRKREKDKLKKRELRQNPDFRSKEKEQARMRMRLKRTDPDYRRQERDKDRLRRRQARMKNTIDRDKERERDRQYKRMRGRERQLQKLEGNVLPVNIVNSVSEDSMPYIEVDLSTDPTLSVSDDQMLDV